MGEVVALRPEPVVDAQRVLWIETMCLIAGVPEKAASYLACNASRRRIALELWAGLHGRNGVGGSSLLIGYMRGRHGPYRRDLPIHPGRYGVRRRPI